MAKFLIYNKTHWYDLPSKLEPTKTGYDRNVDVIDAKPISVISKIDELAKLTNKYEAKPVIGDIIETRKDGSHLCGKEFASFILLEVLNMDESVAEQFTGSLKYPNEQIKFNHRCNIDLSGLKIDEKTKEASISIEEFNTRLEEKTLEEKTLEEKTVVSTK